MTSIDRYSPYLSLPLWTLNMSGIFPILQEDTLIDALIEVLSTHGLAGLCLGFFAYLSFDQHSTIKKLQQQMHDQHKITAIKIEQSMANLEHAVYEMQGDTARMQGQMSAQRR